MKTSITVMVPAYNEEKGLKGVVIKLDEILKNMFKDYEILIFDDCSSDKTPQIADELQRTYPKVKVIHNKTNRGLGYNYRKGAHIAKKEYYTFVPGDGETQESSIKSILKHAGEADIISTYTANKKVRTTSRRTISYLFTTTLNILFGLKLKYYNGIAIHKTSILKKVNMITDSFAYQAEILIKLIRKGYSYKEVPMYIKAQNKTSIFKLKNVWGVIRIVARLFFEIRILGIFNKKETR